MFSRRETLTAGAIRLCSQSLVTEKEEVPPSLLDSALELDSGLEYCRRGSLGMVMKPSLSSTDASQAAATAAALVHTQPAALVRKIGLVDITYVASLRVELWHALSCHLADRRKTACLQTLEALSRIEIYWGKQALPIINDCRTYVEDRKYDFALKEVLEMTGSLTVKAGVVSSSHPDFYVLVVVPESSYESNQVEVNLAAEMRQLRMTEGTECFQTPAKAESPASAGSPTVSSRLNSGKYMSGKKKATHGLTFEIVEVSSARQALLAVLINPEILCVVVHDNIAIDGPDYLQGFEQYVRGFQHFVQKPLLKMQSRESPVMDVLVEALKHSRRELCVFCICDYLSLPDLHSVGHLVNRSFSELDDHADLYEAVIECMRDRQRTPFFDSLREYAERPIGVFHALPISRGNSIRRSRWIQYLLDFYGRNLFKAESSATCGGLDSLLEPQGTLKEAQEKAAVAFGAAYCFFGTNGTSTSNKIVLQALLQPDNVALVDRNCHKSHHYGFVLVGARPCYLDAYPLNNYCMYGGVRLYDIKKTLLEYRANGRLDEVKILVLTNCTFDGLVYNPLRIMEECLAIKPTLMFLWDEAWFAYATFHPVLKFRTAMSTANTMRRRNMCGKYQKLYREMLCQLDAVESIDEVDSVELLLNTRLYPDPAKFQVRVYATQSIHKSLTALRQGSIILCNDDLFESHVCSSFREAYFTHMSTSPNYQILATLDVGRAQMELEGYSLVEQQIEAALAIRSIASTRRSINECFDILGPSKMIPADLRKSSVECGQMGLDVNIQSMEKSWLSDDEFVLDPTRLTVYTGRIGIDGDTFKVDWLMNQYGVQVNKTSINSVLFQTNIGTTKSVVMFLISCLEKCSRRFLQESYLRSAREASVHDQQVHALTVGFPNLPNFSWFHSAFACSSVGSDRSSIVSSTAASTPSEAALKRPGFKRGVSSTGVAASGHSVLMRDADLRKAYFLAYDEENCEYLSASELHEKVEQAKKLYAEKEEEEEEGGEQEEGGEGGAPGGDDGVPEHPIKIMPLDNVVSSTFIMPYPPGFPIAVPGQVLTVDIVEFLLHLDVKEIHGYDHKLGMRVFKKEVLERVERGRHSK
eukprot:GHVS01095334.1.p1 GENE.GHVS01095334.1~~GHVS01095334.1.p1  ORF type:complete len:1153 (+),score=256.27 GHVS01095334.1:169-3459(+)